MTDPEQPSTKASRILAALGDPRRPPLPRIAVVVAHPDDETIGFGAQLARCADITVIHTTDGAPRRGFPSSFGSWQAYRDARREELVAAMHLAGVPKERLRSLGWADQQSSLHLAEISRRLADLISGCDAVITHAYEGGHPDHDSAAFAVHAATDLLGRDGASAPAVIEVPLYRAGADGDWAPQSFTPLDAAAVTVAELAPAEQALKQRMFAAYRSQSEVLSIFGTEREWFRVAPAYDFTALPNGGAVLYEGFGWNMTGAGWLDLAGAATRDLALDRAA